MKTYQARFTILAIKKDDGWLVHPLINASDNLFSDEYDVTVVSLDEVKPTIDTILRNHRGAVVDQEMEFIERRKMFSKSEIIGIDYEVIATCFAPENSRFKDIAEIKEAVDQGLQVRWKNDAYHVVKDILDQYFIKCTINNHCIGLTIVKGNLLNGDIWDFYVVGEV